MSNRAYVLTILFGGHEDCSHATGEPDSLSLRAMCPGPVCLAQNDLPRDQASIELPSFTILESYVRTEDERHLGFAAEWCASVE